MAKAEYRSAIRSRKLINMALADLLQEKPLDKITVTDVVRRAEINRGTFYAHYTDIPDVIHHVIQDIFSNLREEVFELPQRMEDIPHFLVLKLQEILEENRDFCQKVMSSSASDLLEEELVELVTEYLVQHEKRFNCGDHQDYVLTIRFCAGGLCALYRDWFSGQLAMPLEELTERTERLVRSCQQMLLQK